MMPRSDLFQFWNEPFDILFAKELKDEPTQRVLA